MPRTDNNRGVALPYRPGFPGDGTGSPEEQLRAVWDELGRIAVVTASIDQPVSTGLGTTATIPVGTTETWDRLFDGNFNGEPWIKPADSFDLQTGVYTIPEEGVYSCTAQLNVNAFDQPGIKDYYAGIRITIDRLGVVEQFANYNGGLDTQPVSVTLLFTKDLYQGDTFYFEGTAVHENKTGTTPKTAVLQVFRLSGIGDNTA